MISKRKIIIRIPELMMAVMLVLASYKNYAQSTFTVTNTSDALSPTVGQLRWAIQQANLATVGPSTIAFAIPTGPYVINLVGTLPAINKPTYIDGTTQPGYSFSSPGTPIIIIDGTATVAASTPGITIVNALPAPDIGANGSKITGIYLRNFYDGISVSLSNSCEITNNVINRITQKCISLDRTPYTVVKGNYINTDVNLNGGFTPKAVKGILITLQNFNNIIGGTTCGEGNTIAYVNGDGIDNTNLSSQTNLFSGNVIFGCAKAIDLGSSGANGSKTYPVIVSTTGGCNASGTAQPNDVIQIFGSTGGAGSRLHATVYMATTTADASGNWALPLSDIKYPFITATSTSTINNTSELAAAKAITIDTLKLDITAPSTICAGEKVTFINPASKCLGGTAFAWDFGDGSSPGPASSHTYATAGTYTVTLSTPNTCPIKTKTSVVTVTSCSQFDCPPIPPPCGLTAEVYDPTIVSATQWTFTVGAVSGGTSPYTYLWYGETSNLDAMSSTTSATVTTHSAGPAGTPYSINVVITDSQGCRLIKTISGY